VSAAKPPASGSGKTPPEAEDDETEAELGDEDEDETEEGDEGNAEQGAEGEGTPADEGEEAASGGEKAAGVEAPEPGLMLGGRYFKWRDVETYASYAGMVSFAGFVWAFSSQLNQWPATPFVLLFYGMLLGAVVSSYAAKRAGPDTPLGWRGPLWTIVSVLVLWFWVPPARPIFYWLYRRVALYFLS
jgi:hypothetical protein